jgi:hypothetical protein
MWLGWTWILGRELGFRMPGAVALSGRPAGYDTETEQAHVLGVPGRGSFWAPTWLRK